MENLRGGAPDLSDITDDNEEEEMADAGSTSDAEADGSPQYSSALRKKVRSFATPNPTSVQDAPASRAR